MYSMVLMAALTTGVDMPDGRRGGRGGGCCGCYGGMVYGGCYGGFGGCYGGFGGCYGGCWGGGYGGRVWGGGYGMGYGGYAWGSTPTWGGYAYSPTFYNSGTPIVAGGYSFGTPMIAGNISPGIGVTPGTTQSFFMNPANGIQGNEAQIVVHVPADATLTIDGQPTQSRSDTRVFVSPPLEAGKTFTYTLRAEMKRDGRTVTDRKTVEVRAGQTSEVTFNPSSGERIGRPNEERRD